MTKYKKGEIVKGIVTGIEKYGIFISLDDYNSGLIHISEISDSYVRNPADYVKIGESIKALVIEDELEDSFHVKLSIKNIDYRINKSRSRKIKETSLGFSTLNQLLPNWINKKDKKIKTQLKD
ncbi:MAG: S1 RNA-binding domain-containing protein [Bacilli bacterium]|nr:S1 RNA-binding domain-containing protein [Bacilli bacterium]